MAFWGVLIQPNKPYTLHSDGDPKRLHISQATLEDRCCLLMSHSVVQCAVGSKSPISLCSLSKKDIVSCQLDLEFEESDNVVFSVKGPRGVYLAGYFLSTDGNKPDHEGEDLVKTDNDDKDAEIRPATMEHVGVGEENIWERKSDDDFRENEYDINDIDLRIPTATQKSLKDEDDSKYVTNEENGGTGIGGMAYDSNDGCIKDKGAHIGVGFGNNEEQMNEKTSFEDVDRIPCVGGSIREDQCVDDIAGHGEENRNLLQKLNNISSEKLLLSDNVLDENKDQGVTCKESEILENGYVSPSWDSNCKSPLRPAVIRPTQCWKLNRKRREETVVESKFMKNDQPIVETDLCPRNNMRLSASPMEKLEKVEVGETDIEKVKFDLPNDALESDSELHKRSPHINAENGYTRCHNKSKMEKKRKMKTNDDSEDDTDLDKYIIQVREPFQREHEQYVIEERKEVSKEKALVRSAKTEEKSHKKSHGKKSKRDQQDGNRKGDDLASEFSKKIIEDGSGGGAEEHHSKKFCEKVEDKNRFLNGHGNDRNQRQNELDANIQVVAGSSVSQKKKKKKKKVRLEEGTIRQGDLNLTCKVSESHSVLKNQEIPADAANAFTMSHNKKEEKLCKKSIGKDNKVDVHGKTKSGDLGCGYSTNVGAIDGAKKLNIMTSSGGADGTKQRLDLDVDVADYVEKVGGPSASQKKKNRKVRVGEGTLGENALNPPDHAVVSQSKLPNERHYVDAGYAHKKSHSKEMKEKKKKNRDLDDDKHLGKKRKKEKHEVTREEAIPRVHDLDDDKHLGKQRKSEKYEVEREKAIDGSPKRTGKSRKKSDVKYGNLKGVDPGFEFAMDLMKVEASQQECNDKILKKRIEDDDKFCVGSSNDRDETQKENATNNIESVSIGNDTDVKMKRKKKKKKEIMESKILPESRNKTVPAGCPYSQQVEQVTDWLKNR